MFSKYGEQKLFFHLELIGLPQERIKEAINHFIGDFTIADVERICPDISRPTIYRVLKELKEGGFIKVVEVGRNARWSIQK